MEVQVKRKRWEELRETAEQWASTTKLSHDEVLRQLKSADNSPQNFVGDNLRLASRLLCEALDEVESLKLKLAAMDANENSTE